MHLITSKICLTFVWKRIIPDDAQNLLNSLSLSLSLSLISFIYIYHHCFYLLLSFCLSWFSPLNLYLCLFFCLCYLCYFCCLFSLSLSLLLFLFQIILFLFYFLYLVSLFVVLFSDKSVSFSLAFILFFFS